MPVACPNCGNAKSFLVKTLQMHVIQVEGVDINVTEDSVPAVFEVLCDECEGALDFDGFDPEIRREILVRLGAR